MMSMREEDSHVSAVLGLDIGGTEIKAALLNFQGGVIASRRISTSRSLIELSSTLKNLIGDLHSDAITIRGVGIGCKGIVDPNTTELLVVPGELNYLDGHCLSKIIAPLLPVPCPVVADNDAIAALEGERRWGAARGRKNAIMLTLGTRVGGAILADGKVIRGASGVAGHLGHITVDPNGTICICGNRGCLQTVFSARAIEDEALAAIRRGVKTQLLNLNSLPPTCHEIFECARGGDEVARLIVERATLMLGSAIASLAHALDPEVVILAGQIAKAGDFLLDPIQREVDWRTHTLLRRKVPVVRSRIPELSGVVGAAAMAIDALQSQDATSE